MDRVIEAIKSQIDGIDIIAHDWASWDDTYEFVQDHNQEYLKSNLTETLFTTLNIDFLHIIDAKGNIIWGKPEIEGKPLLSLHSQRFIDKCIYEWELKPRKGLIEISKTIAIISIRPILTSEQKGPPVGLIAMGRIFTHKSIKELTDRLNTRFNIWSSEEPPSRLIGYIEHLKSGKPLIKTVRNENTTWLETYKLIPCVTGRIGFIVSASIDREITEEGKKSIIFSFSMLLMSIVATIGAIQALRARDFRFISERKSEIISISIFIVVTFFVSAEFDLFEKTHEFTRRYEKYHLDEIFVTSGMVSVLLIVFAIRRWIESIKDRKEIQTTQRTLKRNEERYRFLFDNMAEVLWMCDMDFNCLYVSPSVERVIGNSPEMVYDSNVLEFFVDAEKDRLVNLIGDKISKRDFSSILFTALAYKANGKRLWVETTVTFLVEKDSPVGLQGVLRDVTIRQEAREALKASEEKFRFLVENSNDIYWKLNTDFTYDYISPAVKKQLGYDAEKLIGTNAVDILHPKDAEMIREKIEHRLKIKDYTPETLIVRQRDSEGNWQFLELNAYFIMDNGMPSHVQGVSRKVTDRVVTERALIESEEKFRLLAENTLDCIWTADLLGTFTYINPSVFSMTGYTEEEWIGSNLKKHCSREEYQKMYDLILEAMRRYADTGDTSITLFEATMQKKDGSSFDVEIYGRLLVAPSGKVEGIQGTTKDITQRKQIEANLHQARKMGYLGEMASGIAHEINNPLAGIMGYAELLIEDAEEGSDEYEMISDIITNTQRIDKIVHNLLRFARAEVTKVPASVIQIILAALDHLEDKFRRYNINVIKEFGEIEMVLCDKNLLEQVFINLCSNSVYAIDKKLEITDSHRELRITTSKKGMWVLINFWDNGMGIATENLGKIFDPFFTTKAIGQGTGLGMSLTYGFIRDHGGSISVDSKEGEWTMFTIKLPIYKG